MRKEKCINNRKLKESKYAKVNCEELQQKKKFKNKIKSQIYAHSISFISQSTIYPFTFAFAQAFNLTSQSLKVHSFHLFAFTLSRYAKYVLCFNFSSFVVTLSVYRSELVRLQCQIKLTLIKVKKAQDEHQPLLLTLYDPSFLAQYILHKNGTFF